VVAVCVQASAQPMSTRSAQWMGVVARGQVRAEMPPPMDLATQTWLNRIAAQGGAAPSANTINAVNTFVYALNTAGIAGKMVSVNCFVPDNLTAAITPLYRNGPWLNVGFGPGDLSVNGLTGNGGKMLVTDVTPRDVPAFATSMGCSAYVSRPGSVNNTEMLVAIGNNWASMGIGEPIYASTLQILGPGIYRDNHEFGHPDITHQVWGYWSCNWTRSGGSVTVSAYDAKPGLAHELYGTGTDNPSSIPPLSDYVAPFTLFGIRCPWDPPGYYAYIGDMTYSFAAVHLSLTESESGALWNAVQALRQSLGGGLQPPPQPVDNLYAQPDNHLIHLSWDGYANSYSIYRGTDGANYALLAAGVTLPSYDDTTVHNGTTYYYYVVPAYSNGTGAPAYANATPMWPVPSLAASVASGVVHLTWGSMAPDASGYNLYRSDDGGASFWCVANLGYSDTAYDDYAVVDGVPYLYYLTAVYNTDESGPSPWVQATPFSPMDIGGLVLWLDATTLAGYGYGDTVGWWTDQSGSGNDFMPNNAPPMYDPFGWAGQQPAVRFTLDGNGMVHPGPISPLPVTIFIVAQRDQVGDSVCAVLGNAGGPNGDGFINYQEADSNSDSPYLMVNTAYSYTTAGANWAFGFNSPTLFSLVVDGSNPVAIYNNGWQLPLMPDWPGNGYGFDLMGDTIWLGQWNGQFPFSGQISEVLVYSSVLSDTDRQAVETYLRNKWWGLN
jgi:hypothetical protein